MKTLVKLSGILVVAILAAAQAQAAIIFSENFNSYTNGPLVGNVSSPWLNFSGTASSLRVLSGQASLTASSSEDAGASIGGIHSTDALFASLDFNLSALPQGNASNGGNGTYFFLFKDTSSSNFRARLWVTTNNAAPGSFRVGIANGSAVMTNLNGNPIFIPTDLSLLTTYKVAIKLDQTGAAPVSTLWLNPLLESDPSVTATDTFANTLIAVTAIGLRQASTTVGAGTETVDNILIGGTFIDVIPEPSTVMLVSVGVVGLLAVRRRRS